MNWLGHDLSSILRPLVLRFPGGAVSNDVGILGGVATISIRVIEGQLTACTELGGLAGLLPCRSSATVSVRECTFANVTDPAECALPVSIGGEERLITYTASATSAAGETVTTESVTYAAGAPLPVVTVTAGPETVTLSWVTAKPVLWHTDSPSGSSLLADKLDVGFFPDADFGTDYPLFVAKMDLIAHGAYLDTSTPFSRQFSLSKSSFNLWVGPTGADGEGCQRSFSGEALKTAAVSDGDVILHQNEFRDCAAIALGGAGTTQTDMDDSSWVFTHESGHFLIGLGDEYASGGHQSVSDPLNIYDSEASCRAVATALSLDPGRCTEIVNAAWRISHVNPSVMADRDLESDWLTASGLALSRRVERCKVVGICY